MPVRFSPATLLDWLIGWQGARPGTRARLLYAFCSGIRRRSLISNAIALVLVVGILLTETRDPLHAAWLALVVLGGLLPRAYATYLCRRGDFERGLERKALTILVISGVYGLLWGAGPLLLLPHIDGAAVGILLFVMVFGTIMGPYAALPGIFYVRLATTGIATLIALALHATPPVLAVAIIVGFWLVLRTDIWRGYHHTLRQQFELQETLETRQAELEAANSRTEAANQHLLAMAGTDPLTGAANRRALMHRLRTLTGPAAFIFFDIDYFKRVNDDLGHPVGDAVLVGLTALVREEVRQEDLLARIGGEEFMLVLAGMDVDSAWALAERLRQRIARHAFTVGEHTVRITVSLGITAVPAGQAVADAAELLRQVDAALYAAKRKGRDKTQLARATGGLDREELPDTME